MTRNGWKVILGSSCICAGALVFLVAYFCPGKKPILEDPTESAGFFGAPRERDEQSIPRIIFEKTAFNFGKRTEGKELKFRFPFHNRGNVKLVIEDVKSNCKCAGVVVSDKEVGPGAKGYVEVSVSSAPGHVLAKVLVTTNTLARIHVLSIRGVIEPRLVLSPSIVNFGNVQIGTVSVRRFSIREVPRLQSQGAVLSMLDFEPSSEELEAQLVESREGAVEFTATGNVSGNTFECELTLRPAEELGSKSATMLVKVLDGKQTLFRRIPVTWTVVGNIKVQPQSGFFSLVDGEKGKTATVQFVAQRDKSFVIENVRCDSDHLRLNVKEIVPRKHYSVTASVTEYPLLESVRGTVRIQTTDELQRVIVLPVKFLVLKTP